MSNLPAKPSLNQSSGFSLVELMVALAILAIVVAIALPDYQSSMASNREASASNILLGTMQFARSEAVTRRTPVTVCPSQNASTCGSDWSSGGVVRTSPGAVLRAIPAARDVSIGGTAITFRSDGTSTGGRLTVGSTRAVSVNAIGFAKIE